MGDSMEKPDTRPAPIDISHYYSVPTKRRVASQVKRFYRYFQIPGIAQLAGGLPDYKFFPFDTLEGAAASPDRYRYSANSGLSGSADKPVPSNPTPSQVIVPRDSGTTNLLKEIDLKTALQYGTAQGYPPLWSWLTTFTTKHLHPNVPYKDGPQIILTCGNTDGMGKVIEALVDTWVEGRDSLKTKPGLICEEFCFTIGPLAAQQRGMNIAPVKIDKEGLKADGPGGLQDVLENWDTTRGRRPHLIYTVTIGHNPTGGVQSVQRRKAIYDLCVKYDVIIIEDEPYWYLQYPVDSEQRLQASSEIKESSGFPFLDSLVPSYLSLDYQGRVVRLDTFSKTIAPGCRLGWITAQPALIERLERITENSTQQPSGFVQSMVAQLLIGQSTAAGSLNQNRRTLAKAWEMSGWVLWLEGLRNNYQRRMEIMCQALSEGQYLIKTGRRPSLSRMMAGDLPDATVSDSDRGDHHEVNHDDWGVVERTHMYTFHRPAGGMFLWVELLLEETHPLARQFSGPELATALWVLLTHREYLVLAGPGAMFGATDEIKKERGWRFLRLCFAAVNDDDRLQVASKAFARGAADFWRIKDPVQIQDLLAELGDEGGIEGVTDNFSSSGNDNFNSLVVDLSDCMPGC